MKFKSILLSAFGVGLLASSQAFSLGFGLSGSLVSEYVKGFGKIRIWQQDFDPTIHPGGMGVNELTFNWDQNACGLDEFGDKAICTEMAYPDKTIEIIAKKIDTDSQGNAIRTVYEFVGTDLRLLQTGNKYKIFRMKGGQIEDIVPLKAVIDLELHR